MKALIGLYYWAACCINAGEVREQIVDHNE